MQLEESTSSSAYNNYGDINKVYLNGNVVLTRDKNVLKGDKLVYDFKTGKSELNAGASATETGTTGKPQRVKALFIPDDKNNSEKK